MVVAKKQQLAHSHTQPESTHHTQDKESVISQNQKEKEFQIMLTYFF